MSAPKEMSPQEIARADARNAAATVIQRLAVNGFGGVRREVPVPGYRVLHDVVFDPPTSVLAAAVFLRNFASAEVSSRVRDARGAGASWADIGETLGLDGEPGERAEDAFRVSVGREDNVHWRCVTCQGYVKDMGPYGGHPDDTEQGHADNCARHRAAVDEYMAEWDADQTEIPRGTP